jgi:Flp pilus assembly protein TadG
MNFGECYRERRFSSSGEKACPKAPAKRDLACSTDMPKVPRNRNSLALLRIWRDEQAAQLAEFAITLPLLMVFVVGIFDFSSAYTLKQKLTNAARDAARTAAADPASDLGNSVPASVVDAYEVVYNYLQANQINPCGVARPTGPSPSSPLLWTTNGAANGCPPGGLTLTINRGYYFPAVQSGNPPAISTCVQSQPPGVQTSVIATCVSVTYAYQWQFGRVSSLLGSNAILPTSISAIAVAMNEN